jgi:hypothetical protein
MTWQDRAIELKKTCSWTETARTIRNEYFKNEPENAVYNKVRAHIRRYYASDCHNSQGKHTEVSENCDYNEKLARLLKNGLELDEIASGLKVSERVAKAHIDDLIDNGHCIDCHDGVYTLSNYPQEDVKTVVKDWNGDRIIRFGLVGDNHIGSKFTQLSLLHKAYDMFQSEGITDVYNTGDLTEGENMRAGHTYECYVHGADDYVSEIVNNYPVRKGIDTHYILGNHDTTFIKHVGMNIGKTISKERKDLHYLGLSQAYIQLTPNCKLELRHPGGGSAYAISYKIQKMVDAMSGGEKPNILAVGHFHKSEYLFYRNVHIFQTGTTQAQSNFMRDMGLAAHMGYWIVTAHVNSDGQVSRMITEFDPSYRSIHEDWKSWR